MTPPAPTPAFLALYDLLQRHGSGLAFHERCVGSQAKGDKPQLHLYGTQDVSIAGRAPQPTYIAGIIQQKNYTGFYFMPVYSHPRHFPLHPVLAQAGSGKSCFHIKDAPAETLALLEALLISGIDLYRELGWV